MISGFISFSFCCTLAFISSEISSNYNELIILLWFCWLSLIGITPCSLTHTHIQREKERQGGSESRMRQTKAALPFMFCGDCVLRRHYSHRCEWQRDCCHPQRKMEGEQKIKREREKGVGREFGKLCDYCFNCQSCQQSLQHDEATAI